MPQRPAIVLVHGFWGGAAHWTGVIKELHKRGYHDLHAVENPLKQSDTRRNKGNPGCIADYFSSLLSSGPIGTSGLAQ